MGESYFEGCIPLHILPNMAFFPDGTTSQTTYVALGDKLDTREVRSDFLKGWWNCPSGKNAQSQISAFPQGSG